MPDEVKEAMATSDGSATSHNVHHVDSSTESTGARSPKTSPLNESSMRQEEEDAGHIMEPEQESVVVDASGGETPTTETSTPAEEQEVQETPEEEAKTEAAEAEPSEAEPLLVLVEQQGAPSTPSSDTQSEGGERPTTDIDNAGIVPSVAVSMPDPHIGLEPNAELHRSRSETDASLSGAPSVEITSPNTDDLSNLQEFLSSPHGNNQIVERSPGGRYVRFMEKLGSGASKDVYRAYDTEEGIEVAWNVVHLAGVPKNERNRIVNEVRLLERLHHQNIISFHGSWVNRERQQVNFVTEILSSGTLKSFINKVQVIRWKIAKRWAVQILKGLEYLHSQDPPVIHRDLKCENIFINGTSGDLRIGDLGLSTVHRNGRVLSVLGTPEFMAPDMYEEGSYDEKVDIYAFGMCMLEIFTKEIPYRECNNPAQIYKKVMRGAPPDSLARLKSTHARQFIELCMGYKNEDGIFVRPSATELLAHPFLIKRANDDDEVEVEPPLQEQLIREGPGSSDNPEYIVNKSNPTSTTTQSQTGGSNKEGSPKARSNERSNSLEEDESDRFDEMPDSEVNSIRKVKVLMGRGEELKEAEEAANNKDIPGTPEANTTTELASQANTQGNDSDLNKLHYLVAAAVIEENEQTQYQQPYPDDLLKLVVTLPVEGQTQNVQFDFHLVEDDPIQVAKEMVAELGIPQGAVLEISETISGLARAARTKKHNYAAAQAQQSAGHPGHVRTHSQSLGSVPTNLHQPQGQNSLPPQQNSQQHQQHMQPLQDYISPQHQQMQQGQDQHYQQTMQYQGMQFQEQSQPMHQGQTTSIAPQMQQMQPQHGSVPANDSESHSQPLSSYAQPGMQGNPPSQPSNPSHQHQQGRVNGEYRQHYHQGHVASEGKMHQTPGHYSHPPAQSNPPQLNVTNPPTQQVPSGQQSQQLDPQPGGNNSGSVMPETRSQNAGAYPAGPQNNLLQIQQVQAAIPASVSQGGNLQGGGNGGQNANGNYPPTQPENQSQQSGHQYGHHNQGQQGTGHVVLQGGSGQGHQQQMQGDPQSLGQGYNPNPQQPPMHQISQQQVPQQSMQQLQSVPQQQHQNPAPQQQSMQQGQNVQQGHSQQQSMQQGQNNVPLQQQQVPHQPMQQGQNSISHQVPLQSLQQGQNNIPQQQQQVSMQSIQQGQNSIPQQQQQVPLQSMQHGQNNIPQQQQQVPLQSMQQGQNNAPLQQQQAPLQSMQQGQANIPQQQQQVPLQSMQQGQANIPQQQQQNQNGLQQQQQNAHHPTIQRSPSIPQHQPMQQGQNVPPHQTMQQSQNVARHQQSLQGQGLSQYQQPTQQGQTIIQHQQHIQQGQNASQFQQSMQQGHNVSSQQLLQQGALHQQHPHQAQNAQQYHQPIPQGALQQQHLQQGQSIASVPQQQQPFHQVQGVSQQHIHQGQIAPQQQQQHVMQQGQEVPQQHLLQHPLAVQNQNRQNQIQQAAQQTVIAQQQHQQQVTYQMPDHSQSQPLSNPTSVQMAHQVAPDQGPQPGHPQHIVPAASSTSLHQQDASTVTEFGSSPLQQSTPPQGRESERSSSLSVEVTQSSSGLLEGSTQGDVQHDSQTEIAIEALGGLPMERSSDDDDLCAEELRKLDEDFQKNLMRAKKVFVNRMDNLQRTQVQREAQHKKTLEQHQKERAAFEKRLQQEEIEQQRRIEQMQKEWDRRREQVRLKQLADEENLSSTPPTGISAIETQSSPTETTGASQFDTSGTE